MQLGNSFLKRFKRIRRNDPIFGAMLYMGDRAGYWEGRAMFAPVGSTIELFVNGRSDDRMEQQHELFQKIFGDWLLLRESIGRKLLTKWHERNPKTQINSAWNLFTPSSITIPSASMHDADWEISFASSSDSSSLWTVTMKGSEPQDVSIDD